MNKESYDQFNNAITDQINELMADYAKLKSVDDLLGEDATQAAKDKVLDMISLLQKLRDTVLEQRSIESLTQLANSAWGNVQNATQSNN